MRTALTQGNTLAVLLHAGRPLVYVVSLIRENSILSVLAGCECEYQERGIQIDPAETNRSRNLISAQSDKTQLEKD